MLTRRTLIEAAGAAVVSALATTTGARAEGQANGGAHAKAGPGTAGADVPAAKAGTRSFVFFSKHLPDLNWTDLASAVKDMGYDGIDLTVRPKGHVPPERVTEDLPKALDAIRAKGTTVAMITTELTSASHPTARPILEAASKAGIRLIKAGYWRYELKDVRAELQATARDLSGLAALAREHGVAFGMHNHQNNVGGGIFDIAPHMDAIDAAHLGYYFDPRHALMEGGGVSWKAATLLVAPRLKMISVKDAFWEKTPKGWTSRHCPMGEGMVDWPWFARAIVQSGFAGPISMHVEYPVGGSTPDEIRRNMIAAATRDLAFIKKQFDEVRA